jgi:CheY-like chemotaxis protein
MAAYKKILLAEDDEDDKMLFSEIVQTLQANGIAIHLDVVDNGLKIIQLLENEDPLPDLVVLDQNMPRLDGRKTLEIIRGNHKFFNMPVVIYSTHNDNRLVTECLSLGAAQILTKPDSFEGFREMISMLVQKYLAGKSN